MDPKLIAVLLLGILAGAILATALGMIFLSWISSDPDKDKPKHYSITTPDEKPPHGPRPD